MTKRRDKSGRPAIEPNVINCHLFIGYSNLADLYNIFSFSSECMAGKRDVGKINGTERDANCYDAHTVGLGPWGSASGPSILKYSYHHNDNIVDTFKRCTRTGPAYPTRFRFRRHRCGHSVARGVRVRCIIIYLSARV